MIVWLGLGFIAVVLLWVICITALDMLDEYDRRRERETQAKFTDRLVRYQEKNY